MHKCPCPEHQGQDLNKPCKFNGRRMIELANGKCSEFLSQLKVLRPQSHDKAAQALSKLEAAGDSETPQLGSGPAV